HAVDKKLRIRRPFCNEDIVPVGAARGNLSRHQSAPAYGGHRRTEAVRLPVSGRKAESQAPGGTYRTLAMTTTHVGLAATTSTTYSDPYTVARTFGSLDHISGRPGTQWQPRRPTPAATSAAYRLLPEVKQTRFANG